MDAYQKDPGETLDCTAEFDWHCVNYRQAGTAYALNAVVQPQKDTGFDYKATTAGRTGSSEPRWPIVIGGTVTDGSVVWTAQAVSTGSLVRTLSSAAWTADTGITVGTPTTTGTRSTVLISGGTEDQDYEVVCTGTCSDGTYPVVTFTIQVRRPARTVACAD